MDRTRLLRVARALVLEGGDTPESHPDREAIFDAAGVSSNNTFRSAAKGIGGHKTETGLRFFDATRDGVLAFGPGAGVCVGVSIGARSVRAVLIDSNGWQYASREIDSIDGQLADEPKVLLARVRKAVIEVIKAGIDRHPELLVGDALPLLGCSVAWPTPISRDNYPVGHGLAHPTWNNSRLDRSVQVALGLGELPVFVMSDAHAAAIAVARRETRGAEPLRWPHPRLTIVLRLAGNVSGAVIVVERTKHDPNKGPISGFERSILLGGFDNLAGEVGHVPVSPTTIGSLDGNNKLGLPVPARCSCTLPGEPPPEHLEAYASVLALTQRLYPNKSRGAALKAILKNPTGERHRRALKDIGTLVGETMFAPVMMLNPGSIVLTGSLALPPLEAGMREHLSAAYRLGSEPRILSLAGEENENIRAVGAALAMIRVRVYRQLEKLLTGGGMQANVAALTVPVRRRDL
jgi:predicted NBD/HSP70 family sugar kinase